MYIIPELVNQDTTQHEALPPDLTPRAAPKKSRQWIVWGGLAALVLLCSVTCGPFMFNFVASMPRELDVITQVLDKFMQAMADRDAPRAVTFVVTSGEQPVTMQDVETMLRGNRYILFKDYRELALTEFTVTQTGADKYAEVAGQILYHGDFVGEFSAAMLKENDVWKIQTIQVHVPPEKFAPTR